MRRVEPALLVIAAGVAAALHVGKLPPALPALRESLGITLLEAGFLISLVQLAGMGLGLAVGLAADGVGLKRTMVAGLGIVSAASLLGAAAQDATTLLLLRALEGLGFLLTSVPAPSLIRQLVPLSRMNAMLGFWGAYMPLGTAMALLVGPLAIASSGWRSWWLLLGLLSLAMAVWLVRALPVPGKAPRGTMKAVEEAAARWPRRLGATLSSPGPWLVALSFAMYSGQWLAVIGFLPSIYTQAGLTASVVGLATALAAAVNIAGNVASGRLLQCGVKPQRLLYLGYSVMGICGLLAFAPVWGGLPSAVTAWLRYGAILLFSMIGGVIPGTLFSLAVRLAPGARTVSTTVGWVQQWSAFGQFAGPPVVAWVATRAGGWQWSWLVTGGCAVAGLASARGIGQLLFRSPSAGETCPADSAT